MEDYYKTLGVPREATQAEIKAAYKSLAQKLHPDKCDDIDELFQDINEAYGVLSNPDRRKQYDLTGNGNLQNVGEGARNVPAKLFAHAIDKQLSANNPLNDNIFAKFGAQTDDSRAIVGNIKQSLINRNRELKKGYKITKKEIEQTESMRSKVIVKHGINLFHAILEQKAKQLELNLHSIKTEKAVNEAAINMLEDYEDCGENVELSGLSQYAG